MFRSLFLGVLLLASQYIRSQNFASYFTGNSEDAITSPKGGICLMGGATEDDFAMRWFLQQADGGDILVLRTSGSDGYNDYLYSTLGVNVNSVESIVYSNPSPTQKAYVLERIERAEGIWFAGGDQWNYISSWRNTAFDSLINLKIQQKKIVIGGTSAGMAIQGKYYFSAQNGTITSQEALANPYNPKVKVDSTSFLKNKFLEEVITDTHFDNPDRKGRLVVFLARINVDYQVAAKAISCDEYTAVCIDTNGIARVFGGDPQYDDNAYFVQTNCENENVLPEVCLESIPLTWNHQNSALKVYQIKGTSTGNNTFDLSNWKIGNGGNWKNWSVNNGISYEENGALPNCFLGLQNETKTFEIQLFPNPFQDQFTVRLETTLNDQTQFLIYDNIGCRIPLVELERRSKEVDFKLSNLKSGVYYLVIKNGNFENRMKIHFNQK